MLSSSDTQYSISYSNWKNWIPVAKLTSEIISENLEQYLTCICILPEIFILGQVCMELSCYDLSDNEIYDINIKYVSKYDIQYITTIKIYQSTVKLYSLINSILWSGRFSKWIYIIEFDKIEQNGIWRL